jgi:hypothetical protein
MYLDVKGFVTCGVGHLLIGPAEAQKLLWFHKDGSAAAAQEVSDEFWRVHGMEKAHVAEWYEIRTSLRLTEKDMRDLLDKDIFANSPALFLPGFDAFPEPAQEALLDMSFQCGAEGLIKGFPHMIAAVRARDWNTAAQQCWRQGIQDWRNQDTVNLFKRATQPVVTTQ